MTQTTAGINLGCQEDWQVEEQKFYLENPAFRGGSYRYFNLTDTVKAECDIFKLMTGYNLVQRDETVKTVRYIFRSTAIFINMYRTQKEIHLSISWHNREATEPYELMVKVVKAVAPYIEVPKIDETKIIFSRMTNDGPSTTTEVLNTPPWADISCNYGSTVNGAVSKLIKLERQNGKLILLHGPPGSGKTYAVRAIAKELSRVFRVYVVTDPEEFTRNAQYYFDLSTTYDYDEGDEVLVPFHLKGTVAKKRPRSLFILEDCADFVMPESRAVHYDKFGKLLNMTDGFFGQGKEDLFLITFNEEVSEIDPAILRPGRCLANIKIPKLTAEESNAWLKAHNSNIVVADDMSLAELYNSLGNEMVVTEKPKFGFGK